MNYENRLSKLQKILEEHNCDALLVEDPVNLYYLTGLNLSTGLLIAHSQGGHLFVDNRYYELALQSSPFPVVLIDKTTLVDFLATPSFAYIKTIAFDSEHTTFKRFQELEETIECALVPLQNPVMTLRMIKDSEELELLRQAAHLGGQGFDYVCTLLKEGITEAEIALELEIFWKRKGSKALAFDPIIAFGSSSSMPHYRAGSTQLRNGMHVLIDIGVNLAHYHSDMTRVVYCGTADPKMQEIYEIVKRAQQLALEICRPGVLIKDVDHAARSYIASQGYGDNFTHSLGHGVGLEIHEAPALRNKPPYKEMPLKAGMVITIEPGIYLPGIGGVRYEDTIAITATGYDILR